MEIARSMDQFFETFRKRAYIGRAIISSLAGNNSHVQLWNPDTSVLLVVRRIFVSGTESNVNLGSHNAIIGAKECDGYNKYFGEPVGSGDVYTGHNTGMFGNTIGYFYTAATYEGKYPLFDNIIVPGNWGVHVAMETQELGLMATFEWIELPV